jgi:hypothetical protein
VFLTSYCRDVLLQWKSITGPTFSEFVFANPQNPSMQIKDYKRQWRTVAKKAEIVGHRLSDTRSTFASRVNLFAHSILTVFGAVAGHGAAV